MLAANVKCVGQSVVTAALLFHFPAASFVCTASTNLRRHWISIGGRTTCSSSSIHQTAVPVDGTDARNSTISWLASRLGLDPEQAASIAADHPPLLDYNIEKRIEPTLRFYEDALLGEEEKDDDSATQTTTIRLATLLCDSPGLLEYNVKKRLIPRLARVRDALTTGQLDEESVIAIATKTDSRFDEWLKTKKGNGDDSSTNDDCTFDQDLDDDGVKRTPSSFIVLSNLQSGGNIGTILRSASIFGCEECLVVGQKRYRLSGEHGSRFNLPRRHLWSHADAKEYLQRKGVRVYGVEIMAGAKPIMRFDPDTGIVTFPFDRKWQGAAFVMGNEGSGLSQKQREICDEFVFIPQTRGGTERSGGGSASLNVACAATVVLQAYSTWACYPDAHLNGEKFMTVTRQ